MRYYIYSRCSTEEQRTKGNSHQYQIEGIKSHPKVKGAKLLEVFSDTITGTTFVRPNLDRMYNYCDIHRGHVDNIFVYRWDRFGRDVGEAFSTIKKFRDLGVIVNCLDSAIDYNDDNWPTLLGVIFGMAQSESLKISSRTKDGMYQANLQGIYTCSLPAGYTRVLSEKRKKDGKRRKTIVVVPEEAKIIKKCFERLIDGDTKAQLFKDYGEKLGIRKSAFYRLFDKFIYTGYIRLSAYKHYPPRIVKGQHPAIITMDTWEKFKQLETGHNKGKKYNTEENGLYLHGVLVKGHQPYTSYYSRGKLGKRYGYYDIRGTKGSIISASKAHHSVDSMMSHLSLDLSSDHMRIIEEIFEEISNNDSMTIANTKRAITSTNKQLSKIEKDYISGDLDARSYSNIHEMLDIKRIDLLKSLAKLEENQAQKRENLKQFANTIRNIGSAYMKSNENGRLQILKAIFPSGFYIEKPSYTLRTPEINRIVELLCSNSAFYEYIKNEKGAKFDAFPCVGTNVETFRTHYNYLAAIKTA